MVRGSTPRAITLSLVIGTVIGSLAPELGNFATILFKIPDYHFFNVILAAGGMVGIVGIGLALFARLIRKQVKQ